MKKMIVYESLRDYKESTMSLNEALGQNIMGAIKRFINKVGKFFTSLIKGVVAPVNVGVMVKEKAINSNAISYIPSSTDIGLEPSLKSLTDKQLYDKRGGEDSGDKSISESLTEAAVSLEHPLHGAVRDVNKEKLYNKIRIAIKNPLARPLMIWGAPGIGKTAIVNAVLKSRGNGRLIDVQTAKMAPDDWALPVIVREQLMIMGGEEAVQSAEQKHQEKIAAGLLKKPETYKVGGGNVRAIDVPKSWLPVYEETGDPEEDKRRNDIANLGDGGVLFLDELSRAKSSVQNTCLKLIGERIIGNAKLGDKWTVIAASNRMMDDPAGEQNFSTALGNRFQQINFVPTFKDWKEWATGKVDDRILDFIEFNQEFFYTLDIDPDTEETAPFASPRSWEAASDAIRDMQKDAEEEGYRVTTQMIIDEVQDSVGGKVATEFGTFLHFLQTFRKEDIREVLENPSKARMPKKAGSGYDQAEANALISLVCSHTRGRELTPAEWANFARYLVRLDNPSLATKGVKMMLDIHPYIHDGLGEIPGKDKYKEGIQLFIDKYKNIF
jgi:hypothetical protein